MSQFELPADVVAYVKSIEDRVHKLEVRQAGQIFGPFATATTGTITSNTDVSVGVTIGAAYPINTGSAVVMGHLEDGSFSALAGWRFDSWVGTPGTAGFGLLFRIGNPSTTNLSALLRFVIWQP